MAELSISAVVAIAKAGIECCRAAKVYEEEAARIGARLSVVVARAHEWKALYETGKVHNIKRFHKVVENVYLCLQVAALGGQASWKSRLKMKLGSKDMLQSLLDAEMQLDTVITDLHLEQSNAIFLKLKDVSHGVAVLLDQFAAGKSSPNQSQTIQQQMDVVLRDFQENTPELVISNATDTTEDTSVLGSIAATHQDNRAAVSLTAQEKVVFEPSPIELASISLDRSRLVFHADSKSLIGGGGFADVYKGKYDGKPVAIKRVKVDPRDLNALTEKEIQRDINRIASEALMMQRCSTHPNVTAVIGCVTLMDQVERPLIIMELMASTLFDVLHDRSLNLAYAHILYLMKGIAGALEFLHLQGIVHQDIKTLNVLVDKQLTIATLADFGEAKLKGLNTTKLRQNTILTSTSRRVGAGGIAAGTLAYQAPEILSDDLSESSRISEMYSFGVVTWECMTRKIPHAEKKTEASIVLHAANKKHLPMLVVPKEPKQKLSSTDAEAWKGLKKVADACLSRRRSERLTSSMVVALWHCVTDSPQAPPTDSPPAPPTDSPPASPTDSPPAPPTDSPQAPPKAGANRQPGVHRKRTIWAASLVVVVVAVIVVVAVVLNNGKESPTEEIRSPTPPTETWTEETKLTSSDGAADDRFGRSVAINGDTLVIGADEYNKDNDSGGSAYVYTLSGSVWTEQAKLLASDGAAGDWFGTSVAVDGGTIVIGAENDNTENGSNSGSVYVFTLVGTVWTEQAKLTASDGDATDYFGNSVAINGDNIVIAAYRDNENGSRSGSAYVYTLSGSVWTEQAKLLASDGAAYDNFGTSVAINGDTIVIGARLDDTENGGYSGSAYVYTLSGSVWTEQAKLTASDGAAGDSFGRSVAINGGTIVIGAYSDDTENGSRSGSAYVYTLSGSVWTEQAKLTASDGAEGDHFGQSVAINGDTIVIGADENVKDNDSGGSAYVYTLSGTVWTEQAKLTASDGAADDEFGSSVAVEGGTIVIGAREDDTEKGEDSGSAYIFFME